MQRSARTKKIKQNNKIQKDAINYVLMKVHQTRLNANEKKKKGHLKKLTRSRSFLKGSGNTSFCVGRRKKCAKRCFLTFRGSSRGKELPSAINISRPPVITSALCGTRFNTGAKRRSQYPKQKGRLESSSIALCTDRCG